MPGFPSCGSPGIPPRSCGGEAPQAGPPATPQGVAGSACPDFCRHGGKSQRPAVLFSTQLTSHTSIWCAIIHPSSKDPQGDPRVDLLPHRPQGTNTLPGRRCPSGVVTFDGGAPGTRRDGRRERRQEVGAATRAAPPAREACPDGHASNNAGPPAPTAACPCKWITPRRAAPTFRARAGLTPGRRPARGSEWGTRACRGRA